MEHLMVFRNLCNSLYFLFILFYIFCFISHIIIAIYMSRCTVHIKFFFMKIEDEEKEMKYKS